MRVAMRFESRWNENIPNNYRGLTLTSVKGWKWSFWKLAFHIATIQLSYQKVFPVQMLSSQCKRSLPGTWGGHSYFLVPGSTIFKRPPTLWSIWFCWRDCLRWASMVSFGGCLKTGMKRSAAMWKLMVNLLRNLVWRGVRQGSPSSFLLVMDPLHACWGSWSHQVWGRPSITTS